MRRKRHSAEEIVNKLRQSSTYTLRAQKIRLRGRTIVPKAIEPQVDPNNAIQVVGRGLTAVDSFIRWAEEPEAVSAPEC